MFSKSILEKLERLNKLSIRYAIFAGTEVALLTRNRIPTDIDIIVHNDDFDKLINIFPNATINRNGIWNITSCDGQQIICKAKNVEYSIDNNNIDIMSNCVYEIEDKIAEIFLTNLACDNRIQFEVNGQKVWLANPIDTIIIKSIMRRGPEQNKFDLTDCQELIKNCKIDKNYLQNRLKEIGQTKESTDFIGRLILNNLN